jgi:hypothetical protein
MAKHGSKEKGRSKTQYYTENYVLRIPKKPSKMDNPKKLTTRDDGKKPHTICVGYHNT